MPPLWHPAGYCIRYVCVTHSCVCCHNFSVLQVCKQHVLHPYNIQEAAAHQDECGGLAAKLAKRVRDSSIECGICLEKVCGFLPAGSPGLGPGPASLLCSPCQPAAVVAGCTIYAPTHHTLFYKSKENKKLPACSETSSPCCCRLPATRNQPPTNQPSNRS